MIPIPVADEYTQNRIIKITDRLIAGLDLEETEMIYDELDLLVSNMFNLNSSEIKVVKKAVDGENKFLK